MSVPSELHISTTGELYSFRPKGSNLEDRDSLFSALRYGEGPDAVLISYGIQGKGYFRGILEHYDEINKDVKCFMGYVWNRHVPLYKRVLSNKADVSVLFKGYPYGEDGPEMSWIMVSKKEDNHGVQKEEGD